MKNQGLDRKLTTADIIGAIAAGVFILAPLSVLLLFPDNRIVQYLFGNGRIFVMWLVGILLVYLNRRFIDRIVGLTIDRFKNDNK